MVASRRDCGRAGTTCDALPRRRRLGVGCDNNDECDALHRNCAGASHGSCNCAKEEASSCAERWRCCRRPADRTSMLEGLHTQATAATQATYKKRKKRRCLRRRNGFCSLDSWKSPASREMDRDVMTGTGPAFLRATLAWRAFGFEIFKNFWRPWRSTNNIQSGPSSARGVVKAGLRSNAIRSGED